MLGRVGYPQVRQFLPFLLAIVTIGCGLLGSCLWVEIRLLSLSFVGSHFMSFLLVVVKAGNGCDFFFLTSGGGGGWL